MGKVMKNGISYSGDSGVTADVESMITESVKTNMRNIFKIVDLGYKDYTIAPGNVVVLDLPCEDKVPSGFRPIAFTDLDFNYGSGTPVFLRRLIPSTVDNTAEIVIGNPGSSTMTGKVHARVLCIRTFLLRYITN